MIKDKRIEVGLTQKQMAEIFEIPLPTLRKWEQGQSNCPRYVEKLIIEKLEQMKASSK